MMKLRDFYRLRPAATPHPYPLLDRGGEGYSFDSAKGCVSPFGRLSPLPFSKGEDEGEEFAQSTVLRAIEPCSAPCRSVHHRGRCRSCSRRSEIICCSCSKARSRRADSARS